jgi:hypothetical protein
MKVRLSSGETVNHERASNWDITRVQEVWTVPLGTNALAQGVEHDTLTNKL